MRTQVHINTHCCIHKALSEPGIGTHTLIGTFTEVQTHKNTYSQTSTNGNTHTFYTLSITLVHGDGSESSTKAIYIISLLKMYSFLKFSPWTCFILVLMCVFIPCFEFLFSLTSVILNVHFYHASLLLFSLKEQGWCYFILFVLSTNPMKGPRTNDDLFSFAILSHFPTRFVALKPQPWNLVVNSEVIRQPVESLCTEKK